MLCRSFKGQYDNTQRQRVRNLGALRASLHRIQYARVFVVCAIVLTFLLARGEEQISHHSPAEQFYLRGIVAAKSGHAASAQSDFRSACAWELDKRNSKYLQALEESYIYDRQFDQALDVLRVYVKNCGPTSLGWTLQAELLFQKRQYDLALRSAESALNISSDNYRAHEIVALVFAVNERYQASLKEMEIAATQNPSSPELRFYLGRLHDETVDFLAARDDFIACLRLKPDYPHALENLGLTYEALGNLPKAMNEYRKALALEKSGKVPPSEYPYVCLGLLLDKLGRTTEAVSLIEQGWRRNPNSTWANCELGRILLYANRDKSAEYYLKRAETLDPTFSRVHYFLALLYRRTNRPKDARAELAAFTSLNKTLGNREPRRTTSMMDEIPPRVPASLPDKNEKQGLR